FTGPIVGVEDRVTGTRLTYRSNARNYITDFARPELIGGHLAKLIVSDLVHFVDRLAGAERDVGAFLYHSIDYAHARNRAAVFVIIGVVDQGAERSILVAAR